jgi:hypothetical protein
MRDLQRSGSWFDDDGGLMITTGYRWVLGCIGRRRIGIAPARAVGTGAPG